MAVVCSAVILGGIVLVDGWGEGAPKDASPADSSTTTTEPTPQGLVPLGPCAPAPVTTEARAAYVVMAGFAPSQLDRAEAAMASATPPAGFFVNSDLTTDTGPRLLAMQQRRATLVAIDDEGGRVQRIEDVFGSMPSAADQAAQGVEIESMARTRGAQLIASGINVDFAPVVDLRSPSSESVIGDRSYGSTASAVIRDAGAFAEGLRTAGVLPTLKHFPGHGRSSGDSHLGAVTTPPLASLESSDLAPFEALVDDPPVAVMVGHLEVPGLTASGEPSSVSPAAYSLLRQEFEFDGLVITDDLSDMAAITDRYTPAQAAALAIGAGADLVLFHDDAPIADAGRAIVAAVDSGAITPDRLSDAVSHVRIAMGCGD